MEWLFVVLGIPVGVLATRFNDGISWLQERRRYGKLRIVGTWGEYIQSSQDRQFSVARIYYNRRKRTYKFDGTNYRNDGTPFCHWKSTACVVDREAGTINYMFATSEVANPSTSTPGYGLVSIGKSGKTQIPVDGFYSYTTPNRTTETYGHTMIFIPGDPPPRTDNAGRYLADHFAEFQEDTSKFDSVN